MRRTRLVGAVLTAKNDGRWTCIHRDSCTLSAVDRQQAGSYKSGAVVVRTYLRARVDKPVPCGPANPVGASLLAIQEPRRLAEASEETLKASNPTAADSRGGSGCECGAEAEADRQQAGSYKSGAVVVRTYLRIRVDKPVPCGPNQARRSQLAGDQGATSPRGGVRRNSGS